MQFKCQSVQNVNRYNEPRYSNIIKMKMKDIQARKKKILSQIRREMYFNKNQMIVDNINDLLRKGKIPKNDAFAYYG